MNHNYQPKIVVFTCENSGWLALKHASALGLLIPERVEFIKLPCSGKVDLLYLLKALEKVDGTLVIACQKENCKFLKGNLRAEQRVNRAGKLLKEIGLEEERVRIVYLAANMEHKFAETVQNFYDKIRELGPNRGKVMK